MDIEQLREYCLSLPASTEDVKWETNLVFSVGGKMFCIANLESPFRFSFKVRDEEFEEINSRDGFKPAPYLARAKWVLVTSPDRLHTNEWKEFVKNSYELIKQKLPKKIKAELKLD